MNGAFDPQQLPPWPTMDEPNGVGGAREPGPWENLFEPLDAFIERTDKEPRRSWLIPDLLPDRGGVFAIAEPNAGKTWLALLGCKAAALDGRDVFIIEEEGSGRDLGWRLKTLGIGGRVHIAHARTVLIDDQKCRDAIVAKVRSATRPVVVFDPFTSLHTGDENDTKQMNNVRRYLSEVSGANPSSLVIVCHHTSKNRERSDMYAGRGSSVLAGWVDVQLNLTHTPTKKEEGRVALQIHLVKDREGPRGLKRNISIDLSTGEVEMSDPSEETAEEVDGLITTALADAPGGLRREALVGLVRRKKQTVLSRLKAMIDRGDLDETKADGKRVVRLRAQPIDALGDA